MNEKTIEYRNGETDIKITVALATVLMGFKRGVLINEGMEADDKDDVIRTLRLTLYPNMVSCVTAAEGLPWPLPFEDWLQLPEQFCDDWLIAVQEVNPHWFDYGEGAGEKN